MGQNQGAGVGPDGPLKTPIENTTSLFATLKGGKTEEQKSHQHPLPGGNPLSALPCRLSRLCPLKTCCIS